MGSADPNFGEASTDFIYDPTLADHLFLSVASQPLGDKSPDRWVAEHLAECPETKPTAIDGATGLIGGRECNVVAVPSGGRGYLVRLYTSDDEAWLAPTYDRAWFETVLATVQLQPDHAFDVAPSASP